jgi:hypothetical protein
MRLVSSVVFLSALTVLGGSFARAVDEPPVVQLVLQSPLDYQVVQRGSPREGVVAVEGSWKSSQKGPLDADRLEARLVAKDAPPEVPWIPLPFTPLAKGFRGELPVATGGWYRLELRLVKEAHIVAEEAVAHVGVGDVFLIAGQSNSANYGETTTRPQSGLVSAFDGEHWAPANDPQPGATGTKGSFIPSFGDALTARSGAPVGVICIGVGSTSVREWMPRGTEMKNPPTTGAHTLAIAGGRLVSSGELFDRLVGRLRQFPAGGIRAVLWHQGESDWSQKEPHTISIEDYRSSLGALIIAARAAAKWDVPWFVAQTSYGTPSNPGSDAFRAAQRSLADNRLTFVGPNTDTLSAEFREKNGAGVHFNGAGLKRHGEMWAEIVGQWIDERK